MKIRKFLLLLSCLLLLGCQPSIAPQGTTVQVSRAINGQTIEILDPTGQTALNQRVRLLGIDAPLIEQEPWGTEARQRLAELVEGQTVLLEADLDTRDSYDRIWGYVWLGDRLVNQHLVEEGWALAEVRPLAGISPRSPDPKYEQRFSRAQEKARLLGIGIWNPEQPMRQSPCEFHQQRSPDENIPCPN
ncbi:MAG: thermonuclease family protein [Leptolyngbyaceae cyanobacterium SL_5_9]|nr:thermonuclease family protein [Leptolyngbyaceae cyanobacterium SL_5_9]